MLRFVRVALFAIVLQNALANGPFVRQLSIEQVDRLASWTEEDKQNIWELSGQIEGDMVLIPGQRNGLLNPTFRWNNNEIPYAFDPVFTPEEVDWIVESLKQYTEKTCLTVRPKTESDVDYVYVTGEDSGCWSYVGRLGGLQVLNYQRGEIGVGCLRAGTIVHEFLHAAGFYHEHSASERDDYVDIIWENIQQGTESNFAKYPEEFISSFGESYDYDSVMHYSAYAFSRNDEMTIVPKDSKAEIGQRIGLSDIDAKKVNKMYGCA